MKIGAELNYFKQVYNRGCYKIDNWITMHFTSFVISVPGDNPAPNGESVGH